VKTVAERDIICGLLGLISTADELYRGTSIDDLEKL